MVLETILSFLPLVIALLSECAIVKWAVNVIRKIKETNELKVVLEQNKVLLAELQEAKKLNKELLTKIDRIARKEE